MLYDCADICDTNKVIKENIKNFINKPFYINLVTYKKVDI